MTDKLPEITPASDPEALTQEETAALSPALKMEYTVRYNAQVNAMKAYVNAEQPSRSNRLDWDDAKEQLREFVATIRASQGQETTGRPQAPKIQAWAEFRESKSKADILRQLQDLGYEITQRTFYRHCSIGKCQTGKDKKYTRRTVKAYVEAEGLPRNGVDADESDGPSGALSVEKQRLENEKLRLHNATAEIEYKKKTGQLIEREALYLELAARAVAIDNGFLQMVEIEAAALIVAVRGDQSRQPEFVSMLRDIWHTLLNTYSTTDEFEVLFEADGEMAGEKNDQ
jgi:hypothetical protein